MENVKDVSKQQTGNSKRGIASEATLLLASHLSLITSHLSLIASHVSLLARKILLLAVQKPFGTITQKLGSEDTYS